MWRPDEHVLDPEVEASLDAIDATLAGEPVDPRHAELAELALLLAADRPTIEAPFARALDERVERRFAKPAAAPKPRRRWVLPSAGLATAAAGAVVAVVVLSSGTSGPGPVHQIATSVAAPKTATTASSAAASGAVREPSVPQPAASTSDLRGVPETLSPNAASVEPPQNGRKIVQSAQLSLSAAANRIDDVAQEVFNVVGTQGGIVERSAVTQTGGSDGYAQFQLSVPSSGLADTMTRLSTLRYAHVASRTDTSQDVNNQFTGDTRRLADDKALRTALLKRLANASTTEQVDSLRAQIHDADAAIASDEAALRSLGRKTNYSQISVTIYGGQFHPVPVAHGSSAFTIGKAAHDAVRVLAVAAGVALIGVAALVPVALVGALGWWIFAAARRRRREAALDLA